MNAPRCAYCDCPIENREQVAQVELGLWLTVTEDLQYSSLLTEDVAYLCATHADLFFGKRFPYQSEGVPYEFGGLIKNTHTRWLRPRLQRVAVKSTTQVTTNPEDTLLGKLAVWLQKKVNCLLGPP